MNKTKIAKQQKRLANKAQERKDEIVYRRRKETINKRNADNAALAEILGLQHFPEK